MRNAPAVGASSDTTRRTAGRILIGLLGVSAVALLGVAVWASTGTPRDGSPPSGPGNRPAAAADATHQVRTSTVHGSNAGYDSTVSITRTDVGSSTVTTLDVLLSTQATPASAPTAEVRLVGADHVSHAVALTIIGAGHWTSKQFAIPAGRYALTAQFDRTGAAVRIPMTVVLS